MESQTRRGKGKGRNRPEKTTPLRNFQSNFSQNWSNSGQNRCNSGQTNYSGRPTRFDGRTQEVKGSGCVRRSNTNSAQELPISGIKTLEISKVTRRLPMNRPDPGGGSTSRMIRIFTNHFVVKFDPDSTIYHYDVSIEPKLQLKSNSNFGISKADAQMIKNKVISDNLSRFPSKVNSAMAYDGEKNIYSAVPLPAGRYSVTISKGDDCKPKDYIFTIKLVKPLGLKKLESYFTDKSSEKTVPREILQAMGLVMKEHPSHCRIPIGRRFYSRITSDRDCDLGWGVVALRGFHQSLKPTDQGLGLVVDSIVNPFFRPISILAFLRENLGIFLEENSSMNYKQKKAVETALIGLKVKVNHRKTGQKYMIRGLTRLITKDLSFEIESLGKENLKKNTSIVNYFREKYEKEIKFKLLPCLDLGKKSRINYVPMEFCELVEGQRFPKELLRRDSALRLKRLASTGPSIRYSLICQIVSQPDGPCRGETTQRFHISVSEQMTQVTGRVLTPPDLKLGPGGKCSIITPRREDCQWNLFGSHVFDGKRIDRWAILCFKRPSADRDQQFTILNRFADSLSSRCINLGIEMSKKPIFTEIYDMPILSNATMLYQALANAHRCARPKLQILVCVMADKHPGYKNLKRISETEIGIVTQCCLLQYVSNCTDQYLANIALKINAKVGGSNAALYDKLPRLSSDDGSHVIFIGADVNHPSCENTSIPSMAAVVATINWPDVNRYIARFRPQPHRTEKIVNLGEMCRDILETYSRVNGKLPEKIIFFRDGVSDGQFDMVLNEELTSIKEAIGGDYSPTITLVVAQKRHQTRLFPAANGRQGTKSGNVPPGTVVDSKIVHPCEFDFYLCSHHGTLGTSRPTHYHVLWDEHGFSSDEMQRLIYNLCYTFARCTKPVSLVTPVYYADLVAYRARQYLEGWLDSRSPASTVSSPSSSSSSSSSSYDYGNFLKLHSDLKRVMYFC